MSDKFKIDDRVILTADHLIPFPDWPVWGSKHSCVGTITDADGGLIWVTWDNGTSKMILSRNLSHFTGPEEDSLSPNIAFMLYKRKNNE